MNGCAGHLQEAMYRRQMKKQNPCPPCSKCRSDMKVIWRSSDGERVVCECKNNKRHKKIMVVVKDGI